MPTYEYHCNSCNEDFEIFQRISDPSKAPCSNCGSNDTRRLISHSNFILKGSGWYVTDYARKGNSEPKKKPAKTTLEEKSGESPKKEKAD